MKLSLIHNCLLNNSQYTTCLSAPHKREILILKDNYAYVILGPTKCNQEVV